MSAASEIGREPRPGYSPESGSQQHTVVEPEQHRDVPGRPAMICWAIGFLPLLTLGAGWLRSPSATIREQDQ